MRTIDNKFRQMVQSVPKDIANEVDFSFAIANEIYILMQERGLSKKQFADALGKKPSEVTKWLSGQHNFTIRTLAQLSAFFGTPLISVGGHGYSATVESHPTMVAEDDSQLQNH